MLGGKLRVRGLKRGKRRFKREGKRFEKSEKKFCVGKLGGSEFRKIRKNFMRGNRRG